MEETVMGVYVILKDGALPDDDPHDIGVLIEGVEVLTGLGNIALACALLFGLIYCLDLSYPAELKCTFEVLQKIFLNLDGQRLSSKVQFLKSELRIFDLQEWTWSSSYCIATMKLTEYNTTGTIVLNTLRLVVLKTLIYFSFKVT